MDHNVVTPMTLITASAPWALPLTPPLGTLCSVQWLAGISNLNIYDTNARTAILIKEALLKLKPHIKPYNLLVGKFNTPISLIYRSSRYKQNRGIMTLIKAMVQSLNR